MKKIFTIVAVAVLAITAQAQATFTMVMNDQGFTNAQEITTGQIVAGKLSYEALQNGASNSPKFYTAGGGTLRMYSENATGNGNSFAVKSVGTTQISVVKVKTSGMVGADNYGPASAVITVDGAVVPTVYDPTNDATYWIVAPAPASVIVVKNGNIGAASAQIRIVSVEVTYTDGLSVSDINGNKVSLVKNTNVNNTIVFGTKANVQIINANGQVVKTATVVENTNLDVSSLAKGMYIISAEVNGQKVSQKIIKN